MTTDGLIAVSPLYIKLAFTSFKVVDKSVEMSKTSEESAGHFATARLPLFHGPLITIRIQNGREYTVSKELLCAESPVFTAMFEGPFREAQEQTVNLEEMEGVISQRSLEALLQWLYLGVVKFDIETPGEHISAAIELARLADKYGVTRIEPQLSNIIKDTILANPDPTATEKFTPIDNNTYWLNDQDIISASFLRDGHPVRPLLAQASVKGFLQNRKHKFAKIAQEYPRFGADLLHEVSLALSTLRPHNTVDFEDPIDRKRWYMRRD
ncbi:Uncharacterized protein PEX2_072040 [Penicillium expansum]|uniref:BTB domain-containing protein n=1 Tax=Penicillium expansum TaxID=27334 RepID=A0A0A2JIU1_PENEN|nr:Uncharacterized protein PEX2_072040 [Penicillium expansum]KGO54721.1 Uncharacterized protein PEX2_072040 [Penicillium expansum]